MKLESAHLPPQTLPRERHQIAAQALKLRKKCGSLSKNRGRRRRAALELRCKWNSAPQKKLGASALYRHVSRESFRKGPKLRLFRLFFGDWQRLQPADGTIGVKKLRMRP